MVTMRKLRTITIAVVLLLSTSNSWAEQTIDSEKIIDVEKLKATLNEATMPISTRLNQSRLLQQFKAVNSLLGQKEVPKEYLLRELQQLKNGMDGFTTNFSEITDPLWDAEEKIGETVSKVRLMLTRGEGGEPTKRVKTLLENYDQRLADIAKTIESEKDEDRKRRLKIVFANVLSLRELVETSGSINLGPASEAVYIKIVHSLANLESALTNVTFSVERTRVVLQGQSEWIDNYCDILEGLIESENLANALGQMNTAGEGIAAMNGDIAELSSLSEKFMNMMNRFASKITDHINSQTSQMIDTIEIDDVNIDKKIKEYASLKDVTVNSTNATK
jgi:hypothetical protein